MGRVIVASIIVVYLFIPLSGCSVQDRGQDYACPECMFECFMSSVDSHDVGVRELIVSLEDRYGDYFYDSAETSAWPVEKFQMVLLRNPNGIPVKNIGKQLQDLGYFPEYDYSADVPIFADTDRVILWKAGSQSSMRVIGISVRGEDRKVFLSLISDP